MRGLFFACLFFIAGFCVGYIYPRVPVQAALLGGDPTSSTTPGIECPFYEIVGAKDCVPPEHLTCNEDWSFCTLKDEPAPVSEPTTPPAASQAPSSSDCEED